MPENFSEKHNIKTTESTASTVKFLRDLLASQEQAAADKQHALGKLTARERIAHFLDPDSFQEFDDFARHRGHDFNMQDKRPLGDGVITGHGLVNGRPVCVFAQDFSIFGGALGEVHGSKIIKLMNFALTNGFPLIGLNDSGGARIQEGVAALGLYGDIGFLNVKSSGIIPQISIVLGPAAGGAAYGPALTDFVIMVDKSSYMAVTGPEVVKATLGETVSLEDLGGALMHNTISGAAHFLASSESEAFEYAKTLLDFLPSNNLTDPPVFESSYDLNVNDTDLLLDSLIPDSSSKPYDMRVLIESLVDDGFFFETHSLFAPNIITGFARIEGHSVGFVANQPLHLAGTLDIDACEKAARFVRTCDAYNIPIVTLADAPGFFPGSKQEQDGIIRRGAKLIYAYADCTVPLVTIVTRKDYGGAYVVMGSKHLGADINLAWPTAEIAVMGAEGAVNVLYRKELNSSTDPELLRAELIDEYNDILASPYPASDLGFIDKVILPHESRAEVVKALRGLRSKRVTKPPRKHGNIPL